MVSIYNYVNVQAHCTWYIDSIREMNKFNDKEKDYDARANLETKMDRNLKQFRAQRNFYITGMTLFLIMYVTVI